MRHATPTVDRGSVYVASFNGHLLAIDATNGEERWRAPIVASRAPSPFPLVGVSPASSPVVADGIVYATVGAFAGSPAVADGLVFVGDGFQSELLALDAATGAELWRFTPAARGLFALDAVSGAERWHVATDQLVHTTPAVADGAVYFSDYDDLLYAIDAASGTERWRVQVGVDANRVVQPGTMIPWHQSSAAVAGGVVYAAGWDGTLVAVDAASGTERWRAEISFGVYSSPALAGGVLYIGGMDGTLHAFDTATGQPRWAVGVDGPIGSSPVVTGGAVFVLRGDGALLRFD
jgi:outer membrane protein assembly factor BamB